MSEAPAYYALALQATCQAVNADPDAAAARARRLETLERLAGQIAAASKAFIEPDLEGYTPFEGMELTGRVKTTILRGEAI